MSFLIPLTASFASQEIPELGATPERLIIIVILALAAGWALGQWWRAREIRRNKHRIRREAKEILHDAERQRKRTIADAELEAQEHLIEERRQFEAYSAAVRARLDERERTLNERNDALSVLESEVASTRARIESMYEEKHRRDQEIEKERQSLAERVSALAKMTPEEARAHVMASARKETRAILGAEMVQSVEQAAARAREMIVSVTERLTREIVSQNSISIVRLPNEEMKGRVIGREGRNVRAFEAIVGVDVLLDDLSDGVILSSHDPRRREIARVTLERLLADGRIQPSRIESTFTEVTQNLDRETLSLGAQAAEELSVSNLSTEVLAALGGLRFRTSYSQNVLLHSIETAHIARLIAEELGLPSEDRRRLVTAALLHDIGKAINEQHPGPHALVGAEFVKKHGVTDPIILNAIAAHHTEVPDSSYLATLVRAADALSGARPGARREDLEATIARVEEMERIAGSFEGVTKVYALQAGREIHVVVAADKISDVETAGLAAQIASALEVGVKFPGEARVTVIRETRAVGIASWSA